MGLDQEQALRAAAAVRLGLAPPGGPTLSCFEPLALARAIEQECDRIALLEAQKIVVSMDPADARALVTFLRGGT